VEKAEGVERERRIPDLQLVPPNGLINTFKDGPSHVGTASAETEVGGGHTATESDRWWTPLPVEVSERGREIAGREERAGLLHSLVQSVVGAGAAPSPSSPGGTQLRQPVPREGVCERGTI
jgi:hypothetical protein